MSQAKGSPAWDNALAFERAVTAFRYAANTLPPGVATSTLDAHTDAAWAAERAGDFPAYVDALRALMLAAKREAGRRSARRSPGRHDFTHGLTGLMNAGDTSRPQATKGGA